MKHALKAISLILGLLPALAAAQVPSFPQTLPTNSVVGRTGITAGPSQAIPFSMLASLLSRQANGCVVLGPASFTAGHVAVFGSTGCNVVDGGAAITGSRTISTTAPLSGGGDISTDRTFSITGLAGGVLAGSGPAFTRTPTLGASGTLGSLTFGNATSGLLTLQPVTGALGTVTLSLPAATDTLVGKATTDTLTNKTLTSPSIAGGALSGTFSGAPTLSGANFVTNANLAQAGAATLRGNPTGSTANVTDFTIQGLTARGSPDATNDRIPIYDAASGTLKYVNPTQIASAGVAGVSSVNGVTGAIVGVDTNMLLAKTANYTITSADCGSTIQAGAGSTGLFTVTLPAVAGFSSVCTINVKNGDTGRGKLLSGFPSDMSTTLWPLQSVTVKIINGVWATTYNPGRWKIPGSQELCVRQDGVASATDGLGNGTVAADCFSGIQAAVSAIGTQWDGGGYNSCSIGIYTGGTSILPSGVVQTGQSFGCYLTYNFRGAVTWSGAGACLNIGDNSVAIINWNLGFSPTFACNSGNASATGQFYCHQTCIFDFNGGTAIWLPANGTGSGSNDVFFYVDLQGSASWNANLNVGNGITTYTPLHWMMCEAHCSKITVSGQLAFSALVTMSRVFNLRSGSVLNTSATYAGVSASSPTLVSGNSILINNGTTVPGGAIVPTTGGQNCTTAC